MFVLLKKIVNRSNSSKIKYLRKKGTKIGENVRLSINVENFGSEPWLITLGNNILTSSNVHFITHDGSVSVLNNLHFEDKKLDLFGEIKVGNNVFIGFNSTILYGAEIGDNVIIGANSLVNKKLESNYVYAGVPAKKICTVEEFYAKHKGEYLNTVGLPSDEKRKVYLERKRKQSL